MRWPERLVMWVAAIAAIWLAGIALWPRRPVVYVRRFANLTVHGGHADIAGLEYGLRDDVAMRLVLAGNTHVVTADDRPDITDYDRVVSGGFAIVSQRRLLVAVRITDGSGRFVGSRSWTADLGYPDIVRDRASRWAERILQGGGTSLWQRSRALARRAYSGAVRAVDSEALDPGDAIVAAHVARHLGADTATVALMQAEAERRRGRCPSAAIYLDQAPDRPDDCLLGLLAWSLAYECADPPMRDAVIIRTARRAVATYPDMSLAQRAVALLSRNRPERTAAIRNAVALEMLDGVATFQGHHLRVLSLIEGDGPRALQAAAAAMLVYSDAGGYIDGRLAELGGIRPDGRYAYSPEQRAGDDARLWSMARKSDDWAVLTALGTLARRRMADGDGEAFHPDDAEGVIARALQALDRATDVGPIARTAARLALKGEAPSALSGLLPAWRGREDIPEDWWRPVAEACAKAEALRYPAPLRGADGLEVPSEPNYGAAAAEYERVLAAEDSESRYAAGALNSMYASLREPEQAVSVWRRLTELHPESPNCARGLANALLARWQLSPSKAHLTEARSAFNRFLDTAGRRHAAILETASALADVGGAHWNVDATGQSPCRSLHEDALRYIRELDRSDGPPVRSVRGWIRAQLDDLSGAYSDLDGALEATRRDRRLVVLPGMVDPLTTQPGVHLGAGSPSRGLLIAHMVDVGLRMGDPHPVQRRLLAPNHPPQEGQARLRVGEAHPVHLHAGYRTIAAFAPAASGDRRLLWWFGTGSTVSRFSAEDLNGDGSSEVLVGTMSDGSDSGALYVLDSRGRLISRFEAGSDVVRTWDRRFHVVAIATLDMDGDGVREIAMAANHETDGVGRIVVLDRRCRPLADYWHPGHVQTLSRCPRPSSQGSGDDLAFLAINNHLGAPGQMVGVLGRLRCQGLRAQARPCLAPGYPAAGHHAQPIYTETCDLDFDQNPNVLRLREDGLLHVYFRSDAPSIKQPGVLLDSRGIRQGRDYHDPGVPANESRSAALSSDHVAVVIGVPRYAQRDRSIAQIEPALEALRPGLDACGSETVGWLLNENATRSRVFASLQRDIPKRAAPRTAIWIHFSGHAFARTRNDRPDVFLQMHDSTDRADAEHAISLRELWRAIGRAAPHNPVLITLDCCLAGPTGKDDGSALNTLLDLHAWQDGGPAPFDGAIITACPPGREVHAGDFLNAINAGLASLRGRTFTVADLYNEIVRSSPAGAQPRMYVGGNMTIGSGRPKRHVRAASLTR